MDNFIFTIRIKNIFCFALNGNPDFIKKESLSYIPKTNKKKIDLRLSAKQRQFFLIFTEFAIKQIINISNQDPHLELGSIVMFTVSTKKKGGKNW